MILHAYDIYHNNLLTIKDYLIKGGKDDKFVKISDSHEANAVKTADNLYLDTETSEIFISELPPTDNCMMLLCFRIFDDQDEDYIPYGKRLDHIRRQIEDVVWSVRAGEYRDEQDKGVTAWTDDDAHFIFEDAESQADDSFVVSDWSKIKDD